MIMRLPLIIRGYVECINKPFRTRLPSEGQVRVNKVIRELRNALD